MSQDRRGPGQKPVPGGHRATDPTLTTRDCANQLGVGTNFVLEEIREHRLVAQVIERPGMRAMYRVAPCDLEAYKVRFGWKPALGEERIRPCPACTAPIRLRADQRSRAIYRCPVCHLELLLDALHDALIVAPPAA